MARVLQRPRAVEDLIGIWTYIAKDNPQAADRTLDEIERVIRLASDYPLMGRSRPDLLPGLRSFVAGNYLIYWKPIGGGIEVFRIIHTARLIGGGEFG